MEVEKSKVESLFADVERRLAETSRLTVAERRQAGPSLEAALAGLTREFERFQMIGFTRYPEEIDALEERLGKLRGQLGRLAEEDITASGIQNEQPLQQSDVVEDQYDPTRQMVDQTNAKLLEGKNRALNMLKMANNMRDELNLIDDEVMLQREKLLTINAQVRHAQSVTNQTKKLVGYFTKAVNDDKIVRGLILVVAVFLLVIIGMALTIKRRKGQLLAVKAELDTAEEGKARYDEIDESFFYRIKLGLEKGQKLGAVAGAAQQTAGGEEGAEKVVKTVGEAKVEETPQQEAPQQETPQQETPQVETAQEETAQQQPEGQPKADPPANDAPQETPVETQAEQPSVEEGAGEGQREGR